MPVDDKVVDKIRKLLAKSHSANVHEASIFAAKAQELMRAHRVSEAMLEVPPEIQVHDTLRAGDPIDNLGEGFGWIMFLLDKIAENNNCVAFAHTHHQTRHTTMHLIGDRSDVEGVRYLYQFLKDEVEQIANGFCGIEPTPFRLNFCIGAVARIDYMMKEANRKAKRAEAYSQNALVAADRSLVVKGKVDTHAKDLGIESITPEIDRDDRARQWGFELASDLNVRAKGRLQ
jgi:hypothetical protein